MLPKPRISFSEEERKKLTEAFDTGMNTASKEKDGMVCRMAAELGRDKQVIRVSYGVMRSALADTAW